jgi:hypothetical protein
MDNVTIFTRSIIVLTIERSYHTDLVGTDDGAQARGEGAGGTQAEGFGRMGGEQSSVHVRRHERELQQVRWSRLC